MKFPDTFDDATVDARPPKRARIDGPAEDGRRAVANVPLTRFLEFDDRPSAIFDTNVASGEGCILVYTNGAFKRSADQDSFLTEAAKAVAEATDDDREGTAWRRTLLGRSCQLMDVQDGLCLITFASESTGLSLSPSTHTTEQTATPATTPSGEASTPLENDTTPCPRIIAAVPKETQISEAAPDTWQQAADALGFTRYEGITMTEHQMALCAFPWHKTKLGPVTSWTSTHRCAVAAIVMNPNPRCLYWGKDIVALYNEECIPIFGNKHPGFLGHHPREVWPEAWATAKPLIEGAMFEGKASRVDNMQLFIERHGFVEECFFDGVFLPLPGVESADDCGVVNQFTEITDSALGKRQQTLINDINGRTQHVKNVQEFWAASMRAIEETSVHDVAYALLYVQEENDSNSAASRRSSIASETSSSTSYALRHQIGLSLAPLSRAAKFDIAAAQQDDDLLIRTMCEQSTSKNVAFLGRDSHPLPSYLSVAVEGRGHGDTVTSVAVLPIASFSSDHPSGFLVIGLNPRRPVDDRARTFAQVLRDCLVKGTSLATLSRQARRNQQKMDELHQSLLSRLHESQIESRKLNERFQRICDTAPIGMFIARPDGPKQKLYVNEQWEKTLGMTKEELDAGADWLARVHDDDRKYLSECLRSLKERPRAMTLEYRTKKMFEIIEEGTGRPIKIPQHLLVTAIPEMTDDGGLSCVTGWIQDVSQDRFTQRLLQARLEEVTASKQSAENFIDMVSHEMRNPLSAILQCADGIASITDGADAAPADNQISTVTAQSLVEAAETIILCAQHQKRIVDDILTLSKLDAKLLMISPDKTNPVELLHKVLKMFEAQLANAQIDKTIVVDPSLKAHGVENVMLDSSRVLQIVINLLTNAIKFTSTATQRKIELVLSASLANPSSMSQTVGIDYVPRRNGGQQLNMDDFGEGDNIYLTFEVRDTGKGLSSEEKSTLFQRFSQATAKTYKKYGGSGLGLFISRELTELQGGQIGVSSEAGKGSTFAFYVLARRCVSASPASSVPVSPVLCPSRPRPSRLPSYIASAVAPTVIPAPTSSPRTPKAARKLTTSPMSILIVEDNIINLAVMAKQITLAGHKIHTATNGLEALAFLAKTTFDPASTPDAIPLSVILMDLEMPLLDGKACVRRIREMQRDGGLKGHVPVIAVTANARAEHIASAREAGMDDVVTKPCRISEVLATAEELVAHSGPKGRAERCDSSVDQRMI